IVDLLLAFLVLYNPSKGLISIRIIFSAVFIVGGILHFVLAFHFKKLSDQIYPGFDRQTG
ncbi:MAG TPA: DUF308 domain-containing protein, partial [Puia sp.]|nr:DUF308 domain-containing protein [Puia sp.]